MKKIEMQIVLLLIITGISINFMSLQQYPYQVFCCCHHHLEEHLMFSPRVTEGG